MILSFGIKPLHRQDLAPDDEAVAVAVLGFVHLERLALRGAARPGRNALKSFPASDAPEYYGLRIGRSKA